MYREDEHYEEEDFCCCDYCAGRLRSPNSIKEHDSYEFTCFNCVVTHFCGYAWDYYNINGKCLAITLNQFSNKEEQNA